MVSLSEDTFCGFQSNYRVYSDIDTKMAANIAVYFENSDIDIFENLRSDIKGLQKFGEASVELE